MGNLSDAELRDSNPTARFSDRAADYVKYRPGYPAAAIDAILDGLGDPSRILAADVGAGTGISSRALADRGVGVIAVEPNEAMRSAAAAHPRVRWVVGTAEATGLEDASVDLITCVQAFHWARQDAALREFARILRRPARIAIMWNERDRAAPMMTAYKEAIAAIGGEHPAETREFDPAVIVRSRLFLNLRHVDVPNSQRLDEEGLIGRAMSASYVPKEGEGAERLIASLRDIFRRFREPDGMITMRYRTGVWLAERRG
jgi:SAM-dependent methyltransferase